MTANWRELESEIMPLKPFVRNRLLILIALILVFAPITESSAQAKEEKRTVKVKGTVIAENIANEACGWHVCGLSLIVRIEKTPVEYAVVNVTYMDDRSLPQNGKPLELVRESRLWKFNATADPALPLQQYRSIVRIGDGKDLSGEFKSPAWKFLPGIKDVVLPFGQLVKHYSVDVGKFEKIS